MPFELTKSENGLIIFNFNEVFSESDFSQFLNILDQLLNKKIRFAFMVDARKATSAPIKSGFILVSWMRKRKEIIKKYLIASCLITNYKKLSTVVNWVFTKQKPVSPNIITTDYKKGLDFINKHLSNENSEDTEEEDTEEESTEENSEENSEELNEKEFEEKINDLVVN